MNTQNRSIVAIDIVLLLAAAFAWAGSQGGAQVAGLPVFALLAGVAFIIQWIVFIPSLINKTERFYDLTGSLTYISLVVVALFLSQPGIRSLLLGSLVLIWALRLGSFLFGRVQRAGEDRRFREIKTSFTRFLLAWTIQGLWVVITLGAALGAITSVQQTGLDGWAYTGLILWLIGFTLEVTADRQKQTFRSDPRNKDKFIQTGLWAWSRHPNYFGEVLLWLGIALIALPALSGWRYATLISPVFVFLLLTRVSGVNLLEKSADEKWGEDPGYQEYKQATSVFIPITPKGHRK
jgi:steroid 5-alpha reductase family enzyme